MDEFYEIDYTGRIKRTNEVFDTTREDVAKGEGIFNSKTLYQPEIITREDGVVKGLIDQVKKMDEGEEKEVEVPSKKAYGPRDPGKIDLVPKKDFKKTEVTPIPGLTVLLDGQPAKIQTVSGGRVRVDFNNPLAGKDLKFKVKLIKKFKKDSEKAKALMRKLTPYKEEEIKLEEKENSLSIHVPEGKLGKEKEEVKKILADRIKESTSYGEIKIEEYKEKENKEEEKEKDKKQGENK